MASQSAMILLWGEPHAFEMEEKQSNASYRPQSAEQIHEWIKRHLPSGSYPAIHRPLNYFRIVGGTTAALGVVSFFSIASPYILPVIQNRNLWAAISLITILLFTSGHMFNHIRKVPYVAGDGKGGISYFAGGFSSQYGLETQIVAAMCSPLLVAYTLDASLIAYRRNPFLCNYSSCNESSSHDRPQEATDCCLCVGWSDFRHVQLFTERVPSEKWRISFSSTTVLDLIDSLSDVILSSFLLI